MERDKKEETTAGQQQGEATDEGKEKDLADRDPREADKFRGGRLPMVPASMEDD